MARFEDQGNEAVQVLQRPVRQSLRDARNCVLEAQLPVARKGTRCSQGHFRRVRGRRIAEFLRRSLPFYTGPEALIRSA